MAVHQAGRGRLASSIAAQPTTRPCPVRIRVLTRLDALPATAVAMVTKSSMRRPACGTAGQRRRSAHLNRSGAACRSGSCAAKRTWHVALVGQGACGTCAPHVRPACSPTPAWRRPNHPSPSRLPARRRRAAGQLHACPRFLACPQCIRHAVQRQWPARQPPKWRDSRKPRAVLSVQNTQAATGLQPKLQ